MHRRKFRRRWSSVSGGITGEVFTLSNFYFNPNMDGFYNRNKLTTNNVMNKMNTPNLKLSPGSHTLSTPSFPKELSLNSGRTRRANCFSRGTG